jgi:WD40 repeat protein
MKISHSQIRGTVVPPLHFGAAACLALAILSGGALSGQSVQPRAYAHADFDVRNPTVLAFSANARFLAVGNRRGEIAVFDVEAAREVQSLRPVKSRVTGIAFSADGSTVIVAGEDKQIVEVDLLGGAVGRSVRTEKKIRSIDLSPDGRLVLWAGDDGSVRLLSSRLMPQEELSSSNLFKKRAFFAAFGIEGSEIFVAAEEGRSAFWALGEGDPVRQNELVRESYVAAGRDAGGQLLALGVKGVSLTARAGGSMRADTHHKVQLFDWNRGRVVREIDELRDEVTAVAVSPDRALVAIATGDGVIDAYSTQETRRVLGISSGANAGQLAFSPDGQWLAAGMEDGGVKVWEISGAQVSAQGPAVTSGGDVLSQSSKFEFQSPREPLITSFDRFTMAVLDLANMGVEETLSATVTNLVVSRLANVPFIELVERGAIEQVIGELKLQNTGVTSARDAAEIGRILNTQKVLLGNVNQLGSSVTISLRLVETESARVEGAREILCRNCRPEDLPQAMSLLVSSLVEIR